MGVWIETSFTNYLMDQMNTELPHYQQDREFIDSILTAGKYAISHSPNIVKHTIHTIGLLRGEFSNVR